MQIPIEFKRKDGELAVDYYNRLNEIQVWLYKELRVVKDEASKDANAKEYKRRANRDAEAQKAEKQKSDDDDVVTLHAEDVGHVSVEELLDPKYEPPKQSHESW